MKTEALFKENLERVGLPLDYTYGDRHEVVYKYVPTLIIMRIFQECSSQFANYHHQTLFDNLKAKLETSRDLLDRHSYQCALSAIRATNGELTFRQNLEQAFRESKRTPNGMTFGNVEWHFKSSSDKFFDNYDAIMDDLESEFNIRHKATPFFNTDQRNLWNRCLEAVAKTRADLLATPMNQSAAPIQTNLPSPPDKSAVQAAPAPLSFWEGISNKISQIFNSIREIFNRIFGFWKQPDSK